MMHAQETKSKTDPEKVMSSPVMREAPSMLVRRSEVTFVEMTLSFHFYVDSGDQTQVTRLVQQIPLLTWPFY